MRTPQTNPTYTYSLSEKVEIQSDYVYRFLSELKEVAISVVDAERTIMSWNLGAEAVYGYQASEAIGQPVTMLGDVNDASPGLYQDHLAKALAEGRDEREGWQRKKDGTTFYANVVITPLWDARRNVKGFIRVVTDVTVQKALEEKTRVFQKKLEENVRQRTRELEVANQELEAFSYSVSHDLRAPLRAIIGFSRILKEDYDQQLDSEGQRFLGNVIRNAELMGQLIDDLLKFSRMSKLEVVKETIDVARLVTGLVQEFQSQRKEGLAQVTINDLPPCGGDESMHRQIWTNLIDNAFKYTSHTAYPHIEIGGSHKEGYKEYYIKDNGVGFDMRYADKLFGVFQRLHLANEFEGTGLGLALVKRIVHKHHGTVWADAKEGAGASFYFTIPDQ